MKKPPLRLLRLSNVPILRQLQMEEALLRADAGNWCLINAGSPPSIVLGISSKKEEMIDPDKHREQPIPVVRRFSGGGTVVVDEHTLFVTMICNSSDVAVPPFPQQILSWNGALYNKALGTVDFQIQENDYAIGRKKVGGNAQYICKERWLHHTTLLWDFDPQKMEVLKIPPKMPKYREGRAHSDFLSPLSSHLADKEEFFQKFQASLSEHFEVEKATLKDAEERLGRPHRKATALL